LIYTFLNLTGKNIRVCGLQEEHGCMPQDVAVKGFVGKTFKEDCCVDVIALFG
jgi:hypothetical protein